jgi:nucleoside-diphosphate-sugar epimerase
MFSRRAADKSDPLRMAAKKVLVTGGGGFVGANLSRRLLRDGHTLHLFLRPRSAQWRLEELKNNARFHLTNLADRQQIRQTLSKIKPDWIFHLAAYGAYSFQNDAQTLIETNLSGTVNLVQAAIETGFEVFVNTGSSSEYGFKTHPTAESDLLEPNSTYAVTKAASTLFCQHMARAYTLPIPTLRLYSVYGPYEDPGRLIPTLVRSGIAGCLPALAQPNIVRDFVHIDDVCEAFMAAAKAIFDDPGAILNVGTGVQTRLDELVSTVTELLDIREEPHWGTMPGRCWDTDTWVANVTKAEVNLNWRAAIDVRAGLIRTIEWYRKNPQCLDPLRSARSINAITPLNARRT